MTESSDALPVRRGDLLDGKYRMEEVIGCGGMGTVMSATHVTLGHRVAVKFLLPKATAHPQAIQRFVREARAAALLRSDHVVRVHDIGTLPSGEPFMVMEYLEGSDLGTLVEVQGPLSIPVACAYVLQACEAVAEAHAKGIVHRDLKPRNLFLTRRLNGTPVVKVLDFGISKFIGPVAEGGTLTGTSESMGSPAYMAPEQIRESKFVDARADVWALGAVLFQLFTGKVPFDARTLPQLCAMVLEKPLPSILELRADTPPELVEVVERCMRKDPADRYQSVADLADALGPYAPPAESRRLVARVELAAAQTTLESSSHSSLPASTGSDSPSARVASVRPPFQEGTLDPLGTTGTLPPKGKPWAIVAGVFAAGLLCASGFLALRIPHSESASAVSSPAVAQSAPQPAAEPLVSAAPSASVAPGASTEPAATASASRTQRSGPRPDSTGAREQPRKDPQKPAATTTVGDDLPGHRK